VVFHRTACIKHSPEGVCVLCGYEPYRRGTECWKLEVSDPKTVLFPIICKRCWEDLILSLYPRLLRLIERVDRVKRKNKLPIIRRTR
jgi:hypothetical protein